MSSDVAIATVGACLAEGIEDGVRWRVLRGPASLCAYVGLPLDHPLVKAAQSYDDLPLNVHGGLTYATEGNGKEWPSGYYWWGWDYAHAGDYCYFRSGIADRLGGKEWTVEEVVGHVHLALWDFTKLARLAEKASSA